MAIPLNEAREAVASLFIAYLGRAPEYEAMNFYIGQLNRYAEENGGNTGDAVLTLSAEIFNNAVGANEFPDPQSISTEDFVTWVYQSALGREPDEDGLTYYVNLLESGGVSREIFVQAVLDNARGQEEGRDHDFIANRTQVAIEFSKFENSNPAKLPLLPYDAKTILEGVTEDPATVEAALERIADSANPGGEFVLTPERDTFGPDGGDNTFDGVLSDDEGVSTLTAFDSLDGGAGEDTFNIYSDGNIDIPESAKIQNIENVNFFFSDEVAEDAAIDAAAFVGATTIWQDGSAADLNDVAAGTTVGFRNTAVNNAVNYAAGGAEAVIALENVGDTAAEAEDTTITVNGADLTSVSISGSVAGATADPRETVITLDTTAPEGEDGGIETVTVALESSATIDLEEGFADTLTTFDASASTGGIYVQFWSLTDGEGTPAPATALESVLTGSGNDVVVTANQPDGVNIETNEGDDIVYITGADAGFTISTGEGNDIVQVYTGLSNIGAAGEGETSEESFLDDIIQITDFDGESDVLAFVTSDDDAPPLEGETTLPGEEIVLNNVQLGQVAAAGSLFDALTVVAQATAGGEGAEGGGWVSFTYDDSTYVYQNNGDAAFGEGDGLIQLVGYTGELNDTNLVIGTTGGTDPGSAPSTDAFAA